MDRTCRLGAVGESGMAILSLLPLNFCCSGAGDSEPDVLVWLVARRQDGRELYWRSVIQLVVYVRVQRYCTQETFVLALATPWIKVKCYIRKMLSFISTLRLLMVSTINTKLICFVKTISMRMFTAYMKSFINHVRYFFRFRRLARSVAIFYFFRIYFVRTKILPPESLSVAKKKTSLAGGVLSGELNSNERIFYTGYKTEISVQSPMLKVKC